MTLKVTMRMRNNAYGNECEEVDEELERNNAYGNEPGQGRHGR